MRSALLKNVSLLTLSNILLPFASAGLVVAISRLGGVQLLGEYSYIITFFFIGQTCTTGGLQILITRDVARARDRAGSYFVSASAIGVLAVVVLSVVLLPGFLWSVSEPAVRTSIVIMDVALVPTVILSFAEATLLAFERAEDFVVIGLCETIARVITSVALLWVGFGLEAIALAFVTFRTIAVGLVMLAIRRRAARATMTFDRECFRSLLRQVPTVGAIPVLNALYWRSDTLLLTWLRGLTDVGYYGASVRLLDIARSLPQAYGRAAYPLFARFHQSDPEEFRSLCRSSILWIVLATVPLCMTLWLLSGWIIRLIYGPALAPSAASLAIVAWIILPYALTSALAQILFATGNQVLDLKVNAIALTTNVLLNLILIPRWGFVGTSIAALASISLHATLQYRYVRTRVCDLGVLPDLRRAAVVAGAAIAAAVLVRSWNLPLAIALALGGYGLGLWWLGLLRASHVRQVADRLAPLMQRAGVRLLTPRLGRGVSNLR